MTMQPNRPLLQPSPGIDRYHPRLGDAITRYSALLSSFMSNTSATTIDVQRRLPLCTRLTRANRLVKTLDRAPP